MAQQIVVQDSGRMLEKIQDFPSQLEKGWTSIWLKNFEISRKDYNSVVISGMGGSGIAGRLFGELSYAETDVPIYTLADYHLPGWVNDQTLLVAVSYSGDTEETLDAVKQALDRKSKIITITTGGKLSEIAKQNNLLSLEFEYDGPPRSALGYLYGSLLAAMTKVETYQMKEESFFQAIKELQKIVRAKAFFDKAEELALSLNNKLPIVMANHPLRSTAKRWVNQMNENSKTTAILSEMPEASHNLIVGLDFVVSEKIIVLYLESKFCYSRLTARHKVVQKLIEEKGIPFIPLSVKSGSILAEQLLLIYFGDLLSYYLSGVNGVDPTPIEIIDKLKKELSKL